MTYIRRERHWALLLDKAAHVYCLRCILSLYRRVAVLHAAARQAPDLTDREACPPCPADRSRPRRDDLERRVEVVLGCHNVEEEQLEGRCFGLQELQVPAGFRSWDEKATRGEKR